MADGFQVNTVAVESIRVKAMKQGSLKLQPRDGVEITFQVQLDQGYHRDISGDMKAVVTSEGEGRTKLSMTATRNGSLKVTIEMGLQVEFEVAVPQDEIQTPLEDSGEHDRKPHVVVKRYVFMYQIHHHTITSPL